MCVSLPARLVAVDPDGSAGLVELDGSARRVSLAVVTSGGATPEPGDWVLMSAGIPLRVLNPSDANELIDLWVEIDMTERGEA